MFTVAPTATHQRDQLLARAARADNVADLFATASQHLQALVPFDSSAWLATDPATHVPSAPTRTDSDGIVHGTDDCIRGWQHEMPGPTDVNLYSDLTRATTPAASLRRATGNRPSRSARYRELLRPRGIDDELRAVLRVDGHPWAWIMLHRRRARPPFTPLEVDLVASLSTPLAEAIRGHARPTPSNGAHEQRRGPGLMLFAPDGELISVNDDGLAWLEEIACLDHAPPDYTAEDSFDVRLPVAVTATLLRAREVAARRCHRAARRRIYSTTGRWLVCHASCLRDSRGNIGDTALVIELARASEIAPIIVQSYALSPREQQITQLIAQGVTTAGIARRLYLSTHTVRDYIKAILTKVGVSSRGELVATLFAVHDRTIRHHDDVERVSH